MSLNLASLLRESAHDTPTHPAILFGDTILSYDELHIFCQRFAGSLKELGVEPGQHIALMLPNVPHFTMAYYGGHYAATPIVPLNVLLKASEIRYHLEDSDAVAIVVWEGFLTEAQQAFLDTPSCKHLIVAKADMNDLTCPDGAFSMNALMADASPVETLPLTMPDDTAVILYTSGTTGRPKGAELSHFNLFYNAEYAGSKLMPLDGTTVALATLPLFHSFGQTVIQNGVLGAGGTIVLLPRFEPSTAFKLMQNHSVNLFAGVPTMYFALLNHSSADKFDLSALRYCLSGGSAMPIEVMRAFDDKYGVNILEGYGLSETSPIASFNTLDRPKKVGSIGLPLRGVEFCLMDAEDKPLVDSTTAGEICIKGHNVMKGYYKKPEATREAMRGGWFHTGDIGTKDEDGYYFIVDRKKDMIIRGGFNVYPREIEEVLYTHPAIAEAAVIGVSHESHGEEVKAVVALKDGHSASESAIKEFCKLKLAAYKYPRIVEIVEELPKGPTGKILKRELRG